MASATVTPTPDAPQSVNVQFPSGHVVQFPDEATAMQHASKVWEQLKTEVGALSEGLGGPATLSEAEQAAKNTPAGFVHPWESLKQALSGVAGSMNNADLMDKAKDAWDAGDKVTAIRHGVNALIPFVGKNADIAGDELASGDYAKAVGHTLSAVVPFLLGGKTAPAKAGAVGEEAAVKPALVTGPELEAAIRNRQPAKTVVDETPGAQATIDADIRKRLDEAPKPAAKPGTKGSTLPSTANWQDIAREQLAKPAEPAVSYQDAEDHVLKEFEPKNVDQETFEANLVKVNKTIRLAETEPVESKVASAIVKRHIADSPNPVVTEGLVREGKVPLQDLYGTEFAQKARELDPSPHEVPAHEAGHAVLANHYAVPVRGVTLYPSFDVDKLGASRAKVIVDPEQLRNLSPEKRNATIMGGAAGEKAAGFPYNAVHEGGDVIALRNLLGPDEDAPAAIERGRAEANRLLSGELKGQHTQLTDFFKATWGTDQPFENFKNLLGVMGVAVTAPQLTRLFQNYQGKKSAGGQQ